MQVDFSELLSSLFDLDEVFEPPAAVAQDGGRTVTTAFADQAELPAPAPAFTNASTGFPFVGGFPLAAPCSRSLLSQRPAADLFGTGAQLPADLSSKANPGKRGRKGAGIGGGKQQLADLEAALIKKLAEVSVLETQNQGLKDRARVLEVVVRARDEQVERLKRLREQLHALSQPTDTGPGSSSGGTTSLVTNGSDARQSDAISATTPATQQQSWAQQSGGTTQRTSNGGGVSGVVSAGQVTSGHMLQPFDPAVVVAYTHLSVEELMANHHDIIAQLTAELFKPEGESRLTEMMQNLREFARCMALLSDKFQLMVSRDVSVVPACPATLDTTASGGGSNTTLPNVSHQSRALSGTFSRTSGGTGDGAGRAEDGGADAAAVMAASLVPSVSGGAAHSGELVISDSVTHAHEQSPETQAHWSQVVVALCLSPRQQADTQALWDLHQGWRNKLEAERQRLSVMLNEVLSRSKYGKVYLGASGTSGMTEAVVVRRLHRSVQSEHALLMVMGEVFQYKILDLEQAAKLLITSWPFIPDTIGIMHAAVNVFGVRLQ